MEPFHQLVVETGLEHRTRKTNSADLTQGAEHECESSSDRNLAACRIARVSDTEAACFASLTVDFVHDTN